MAIDPVRKIAFAHPNYMAFVDQLTHAQGARRQNKGSEQGYNPNTGAPFAVYLNPFLSKLGLPCQAPPWGYVAGIDLVTGKVAWRHKNGTIRDEIAAAAADQDGRAVARRADDDRAAESLS